MKALQFRANRCRRLTFLFVAAFSTFCLSRSRSSSGAGANGIGVSSTDELLQTEQRVSGKFTLSIPSARESSSPAPKHDVLTGPCRTCFEKRRGIGVLFFAYGVEERTFDHFAEQVTEAARLIKRFSPTLSLALATSYEREAFSVYFDHIITIREDHHFPGSNYENRADGHKRQYLTRILYLTATPFAVTIAYDTNIVACGPLLPLLRKVSETDFDVAVASTGPKSSRGDDIIAHNFAIAYRWNQRVSEFFDEWFLLQLSAGVALNDQGTLRNAAREIKELDPSFKFKTLNPVIASAFASTNPKEGFYPRETRVISGKTIAIHGDPFRAHDQCQWFNSKQLAPRQVVTDGKHGHITVFNPRDCSKQLDLSSCKYDLLWSDSGKNDMIPSIPLLQSDEVGSERPLLHCDLWNVGGDSSNKNYGAWQLCKNLVPDEPVVWSFGVGCDVTFEVDFKQNFPLARIRSFDPTIDRIRFDKCARSSIATVTGKSAETNQMFFSRVGLASESGQVRFAHSPDPRIGSKSMASGAEDSSGKPYLHDSNAGELWVKNLSDLQLEYLDKPGEYDFDVLKMDIEGSEFDLVMSWCKNEHQRHPRAKQILIEFHERMFKDGFVKRLSVFNCMRTMGYCAVYQHEPKKEEVCFVHLPEVHAGISNCPRVHLDLV